MFRASLFRAVTRWSAPGSRIRCRRLSTIGTGAALAGGSPPRVHATFDAVAVASATIAMMMVMTNTTDTSTETIGPEGDVVCQVDDDLGAVVVGFGGGVGVGGTTRCAAVDDDGRRRRRTTTTTTTTTTPTHIARTTSTMKPAVYATENSMCEAPRHAPIAATSPPPSTPYANFVDAMTMHDANDNENDGGGRRRRRGGAEYDNYVATSSSASLSPSSSASPSASSSTSSSTSSATSSSSAYHDLQRLRRAVTSRRMADERSRRSFHESYSVRYDEPLGSGAYGDVYPCTERTTGEVCALKKIPKAYTEHAEFQREMNALLHIRAHGGHPNICMLRENFDEEDDYLLVLDLLDGGEMFEHLIKHGAYSEADASRLLRQVASALDFVHGIGVVHAGT
jgi:hypothetical protein